MVIAIYFDSRGTPIHDSFDYKTRTFTLAHDQWLAYWRPLTGSAIRYDKAVKLFESRVEIKSYSDPRVITPYKLVDGYRWTASVEGKRVDIVDKRTGRIVISKLLSNDEYQVKLLKRQRLKQKSFIEKALANDWTHWATLTFDSRVAQEASYSYAEAKIAFMKWRKKIVRQYGCDFKYIAVAEYGSTFNRIHWHALLHFDKSIIFEQARGPRGKKLYLMNSRHRNVIDENKKSIPKLILPNWEYGLTDFYPTYNNAERAVRYISKYMTKSETGAPYEQQGLQAKSYLASKGLKRPRKEYLLGESASSLLSNSNRRKIEEALPTFRLLRDGEEVMHKSEAEIDGQGEMHIFRKPTGVIDIAKKSKA